MNDLPVNDLDNWEILTWIGGGDPLVLAGDLDGRGIKPSMFRFFSRTTKTGFSVSGKTYRLTNFIPNGNAPTEEVALDWIEQNWVICG